MKEKVYIASPLFNPKQIQNIAYVEKLCEEHDIPYFSPRQHQFGSMESGLTEEVSKLIFESNVKEVKECDVLIAIIDDKDTGTAWEIGMAYALFKRIILVQFDTKNISKTNIMLSNCGNGLTPYYKLYDEYNMTNDKYLKYGELE